MRKFCSGLTFLLFALPMLHAQAALPAATPTQIAVPWTAGTCPTGDTCATSVFACTGTAATCTDTSATWAAVVSQSAAASGTFNDTAVTAGDSYCFAAVNYWTASGTTSNGPPSAISCATVPLAGGAATLGTLSASS